MSGLDCFRRDRSLPVFVLKLPCSLYQDLFWSCSSSLQHSVIIFKTQDMLDLSGVDY